MRIPFSKLVFPKYRYYQKDIKRLEVNGLDTETIDGYCRLITDSNKRVLYPSNFLDILKFLTHKSYENKINFFYNLDYDIRAIIKHLLKESNYLNLFTNLYVDGKLKFSDYKLKYIPSKLFSIRKGKKRYNFYDLAQYYKTSLQKASQTYLNESKQDYSVTNLTEQHLTDTRLVSYCIQDSILCKKLGDIFMDALFSVGVQTDKPISTGYISYQYFEKNCFIPSISKIPIEAIKYAYNSYSGGWFECLKRGYFSQVWLYDISSAYPDKIADLLDISKGKWIRSKEPLLDADYGFLKVDMIKKSNVPIPVSINDMFNRYPIGIIQNKYITLNEYKALYQADDIIDVKDGWYFYANEIAYPFRATITHLYKAKSESKDRMHRNAYKIIMNSLYGKFFERNKDRKTGKYIVGRIFNPIYASIITSETRLQIYNAIKEHYDKVVMIATDGIIVTEPFLQIQKGLGLWDLEIDGKCISLGCGLYTLQNHNKTKTAGRGFGKNIDWFDFANENKDFAGFEFSFQRPVTLGEVIQFTKIFDVEDLNVFKQKKRIISINYDSKRVWISEPERFGDLLKNQYESKPVSQVISLTYD